MRLREAIGRAVVARDTAETVGQVRGAVVDVGARRIAAVQVGKGHKAQLVDWDAITGVGPDAVVIAGDASLRSGRGEREERIVKGDIALLGGETTVAAARLRSVGGFAVVVATEEPAGTP